MAAPSLSIPAPHPLNRRSLLIAGTALAVAGACRPYFDTLSTNGFSDSVRPEPGRRVNGSVTNDPALAAYARVKEVDSWFVGVLSDEDDPYYLALLAEYDRAEAAFADARATSPAGVRAKLNHVAYLYAPDAEGEMCRSPLATSIVADFERVMEGRAI